MTSTSTDTRTPAPLFTLTVSMDGGGRHKPFTETFRHMTAEQVEQVKRTADHMATDGGETVAYSLVAEPVEVTEYEIAERVGGTWRPLPGCGSWYTDRYYTDDLTGRAAADAALARVADVVPGTYRVQIARRFLRPALVPIAAPADEQLGEPDDDEQGCEGHESLDGAHMGESVLCDGTCRS
jgi:hypothetical protein